MPKILHVIQILTLGGGARALICTAKCSARQGDFRHTVASILPPEAKAVQLARESGLRVVAAPGPAELAAEIEAADIVQMHWWNVPEMTDFIRTRHPPMRLIGFYHVAGDSLPHIITPKLIDYVDMSVPCNPYTYYDNPAFRDMDPAKRLSSVSLVYGAADLDRLEGVRQKPHRGFNVGYIGTIDFIKMHPDYVRMSAAIRIPDVKFIVCGDGSLDLLRRQAAEAGAAERFEFRGYVEDVRPAISEFDVYGYPLCEETYAGSELNLQEIMYAGLAPVVFPYGGVKRLVVNDFTGLIVHSAREYAAAVEYLYHHPAERRRLGRNAKAYAEQIFGAENAARKINAVYNRLLERPKRSREWAPGGEAGSTGAAVFLDTLGEKAGADFSASQSLTDLRALLEADDRIAASTRVAFISGVLAYRGKYPGDPWLRYWAGLGFAKLGSHAEAALEFAAAVQAGMPHWRARWRLAQAAEALGRADLAASVYPQLEAQHPGYRREVAAAQGLASPQPPLVNPDPPAERNDWTPRVASANSGAAVNPPASRRDSAEGSPARAERPAPPASIPEPGAGPGPDGAFAQAERAFLEGRVDEAVGILEAFLAGHPGHPRALNDLGVIHYSRGRKEEALLSMAKALKADPGYADALANLTQALAREGSHKEALDMGYASLEQRPDDNAIASIVAAVEEDWADKMLARSSVRDLGYRKRAFRITALVSTYKSADFIRECLDDLEGQTVARDLEILIVDADSPEGENAIVEEYQRRYDNIRYIRTPERIGIYPAWNLAIRAASGTYLTPMSTNDRLAPDAYEKLMRALDGNPAVALAYGDSHLTRVPHQTFASFTPVPAEEASFRWPEYAYDDLVVNCRVGPHPVWRASLHREIGYFDGRYKAIADQDFWLRIAIRHPLAHVPAYTGLAWLTQDSLSGQSSAFHEIMRIHNLHAAAYLGRARRQMAVAGYAEPRPAHAQEKPFPMPSSAGVALPPGEMRISALVIASDPRESLGACLEALSSQTAYLRGEMGIVVVDAGLAAGESGRLREFMARHDRVIHLRGEGKGGADAWNRAVKASHGRFLVHVRSGDRHREDAFEMMAAELERSAAGERGPALAYADAYLTETVATAFSAAAARWVWSLPDWDLRQALVAFPFGGTVMWRRELHHELGLFDMRPGSGEGYEFFFRAALARGARHIRAPLAMHKDGPEFRSFSEGPGADPAMQAFLSSYRRDLPLERIYPFLETDGSPAARSAAAVDLAACLLDPELGVISPSEAEARLWQALDASGPSSEALIDLVVAAQSQGKAELAKAAFARMLAFDPSFFRKLQGRGGRDLLFRIDHPQLRSLPDVIRPGEARVRVENYRSVSETRAMPAASWAALRARPNAPI